MKTRHAFIYTLALLTTIACGTRKDGEACHLDGNCERDGQTQNTQTNTLSTSSPSTSTTSDLACTATPDKTRIVGARKDSSGAYIGGEKLGLLIQVTGGTGPYAVPSFVSSFASSTTIFGYYENSGSTDRTVSESVGITDSAGHVAYCSFNVTVAPAYAVSSGSGNLACVITPSSTNPQINENVDFTINAWTWSPSPYPFVFGQFLPRQGEVPKALATVTAGVATVSHTYTSTWVGRTDLNGINGYADPAVKVSNGYEAVWCQLANRYMTISPSVPGTLSADWTRDSSDLNNLIKVNLNAQGFGTSAPMTYSAVIQSITVGNAADIEITQDSSDSDIFFIRRIGAAATNDVALEFVVRLTATNGTKTATKDLALNFRPSVACTMVTPSVIYSGSEATFSVNSTNGELIDIYDVTANGPFSVVKVNGSASASAKVTFTASGFYTVKIRAFKTGTSIFCNSMEWMTAYIFVAPSQTPNFSCDVSTEVARTHVGAPVRIDVLKKGGLGDMSAYSVNIQANGVAPNTSATTLIQSPYLSAVDTSSIVVSWATPRTSLLINATLKELATGKTASCQTYIAIEQNTQGLKVNVFRLGNNDRSPLTKRKTDANLANFYVVNQPQFTAANIDVSRRRSHCPDRLLNDPSRLCEYPGVTHGLKEWYLVEYTGRIYIPPAFNGTAQGDTYEFKFMVDDGVMLYLDEDLSNPVVAFDGVHAARWTPTGSKRLSPGYHTIRVRYYQGPRNHVANQFYWRNVNAGSGFTIVPAGNLFQ